MEVPEVKRRFKEELELYRAIADIDMRLRVLEALVVFYKDIGPPKSTPAVEPPCSLVHPAPLSS